MHILYLIDISAYLFRAYYAVRRLTTSKGTPTHATYGVVTMLMKFLREKAPENIVAVFDSPKPSFRKEKYPAYKANREVPPEDLPEQFDHVKEFLDAWPIPRIEREGYEADDLIATLTKHYLQEHPEGRVVIVSSDKDLMQLIGRGVTMYDSMKDKNIGEAEVKEKFGVRPDQVTDVQALCGDASDNIPGVKGIGEKTAGKLIAEFGSLQKLYAGLDKVKGTVKEKLAADRKNALLAKELVTLRDDLPLDGGFSFAISSPHKDKLNTFFAKYEFHSLINKEQGKKEEKSGSPKNNYLLVTGDRQLDALIDSVKKKNFFSFDTETTGLDPLRAHLVGISLAYGDGEAAYIPIGHTYLGCPAQLPEDQVISKLKPLFEDAGIKKIGQNAKYDIKVLEKAGITVRGLAGDTMLASWLIDPEGSHGLDALSREYLGKETIKYADVVPKGKTFDAVPLADACAYAAEDADDCFRLHSLLEKKLLADGLTPVYQKLELPLVSVLTRMEMHGVLVRKAHLAELHEEFSTRLGVLEKSIYEGAGCEFNVQSPKQLADILFVKLQLPPQKKTKTGYSTDVEVLTGLAKGHPLPALLLEHRLLAKLQSTYVDQLVKLINPEDGRIHTHYHQAGTATGRLSSSDPNLQNIPVKTAEGRRIREAFVAAPGFSIVSADYSQVEVRLLAHFSGDEKLIRAFSEGLDVHAMTAEKIFSGQKITPLLRARAKTVNFGILYGQSPFGLARQLDISQGEAKDYIDAFYDQYPKVRQFREDLLALAKKDGYVTTWQGRKRFVPDINSKNRLLRQNTERFAFNTVFQGSAADLIKVAMIGIDQKLRGMKSAMIMQVHDELIFEAADAEKEKLITLIKEKMEKAIPCLVPLTVDIGVGLNWGETG